MGYQGEKETTLNDGDRKITHLFLAMKQQNNLPTELITSTMFQTFSRLTKHYSHSRVGDVEIVMFVYSY